jgi:dTDP-4-dehydrorhamnose reductase
MRIVVTGGPDGQVLHSLIEQGKAAGHEIVALGRPELDLAGDSQCISAALAATRPEAVVSAAAYTAVDKAEDEPELAFAINASGAGAVAQAASDLGVPLVHLSTDYVFSGSKTSPYTEQDPTDPVSVYGASKLAGEEAVLAAHRGAAILRTAWVYSPFNANFVKTMLRLAEDRDEVSVVADQYGNPTSALDIADAILEILPRLRSSSDPRLSGVFHLTGHGDTSWAGFAGAIFAFSKTHGGAAATVRPIGTLEYPTKAKRPANSRLDNSKLAKTYGLRMPAWQNSLERVIARLVPAQAQ